MILLQLCTKNLDHLENREKSVDHQVLDLRCIDLAASLIVTGFGSKIDRTRLRNRWCQVSEPELWSFYCAGEPSEKSLEVMRKFSEQYARRSDTFFCVDKGVTAVVVKVSWLVDTPLNLSVFESSFACEVQSRVSSSCAAKLCEVDLYTWRKLHWDTELYLAWSLPRSEQTIKCP